MPSEGEERPPGPQRDSDGPKGSGGEAPEYTVYGRGGQTRRQKAPARKGKPKSDGSDKPDYKIYRSRPSLRERVRKPDIGAIRRSRGRGLRDRLGSVGGGGRRRWLRWVLVGVVAWFALSFVTFAISAQIQKGKLDDAAKQALAGGPDVLAGQNILILGGDRRGERQRNAAGQEGQGPPRADTIMVLHASLTSFRKLSIPRDVYAAIPDCGSQRINASLACNTNSLDGNPASTIRTVEDFLGIDINHIVIIDFDGFADFINTLGGVELDVQKRVCGDVDGGKRQGGVSINLRPGSHTLEGDKALAFARIRQNRCDPREDDTDRAARQQTMLDGIESRLASPLRLPYNFAKGPWIGWNAPRAFISDMGGATLPQVALAAIFGGSGEANVLGRENFTVGPGDSLFIPQGECRRAVEDLTGGPPRESPACSPG